MNDREKARKLREKGWNGPSASEEAKAKSNRSRRRSEPASGGAVDALRNFDYSPGRGKKVQPVPRSEESKERARRFKRGLPKLG